MIELDHAQLYVELREGKVFGLLFRQRPGRHRHLPHPVSAHRFFHCQRAHSERSFVSCAVDCSFVETEILVATNPKTSLEKSHFFLDTASTPCSSIENLHSRAGTKDPSHTPPPPPMELSNDLTSTFRFKVF